MQDQILNKPSEEEIDFKELLSVLWRNKLLILLSSLLSLFLASSYIFMQPNQYVAEAVLFPQKDEGSSQISSSLGLVASLAGSNLSQEVSSKDLALQVFKSKDFFELLYADDQFLVSLFAVESFNLDTNQPKYNPDIYKYESNNWSNDFLKKHEANKPSLSRSYNEFHSKISISENIETGFISLSVRHVSPQVAKNWINIIIPMLNSYVRNIKLTKADLALNFLGNELKNTTSNELKKVIVSLMEKNLQVITLANISDEFVFSFVDSPRVDYQNIKPNRILFSIGGFFIGFFLIGLISLILKYVYQKEIVLSLRRLRLELIKIS